MIKKILAAVGEDPASDVALQYAEKLGGKLKCKVTAMSIVKKLPVRTLYLGADKIKEEEIQDRIEDTKEKIQKACRDLKYCSITEFKVKAGDPALEIIKEAKNYDLVVIGAREPKKLRKFFLGSVSSKVVEYSPIPVIVIRTPREINKILFCTDGSVHAEKAIKFGSEIAKKAGAKSTVLCVSDNLEEGIKIAEKGAKILEKNSVKAKTKVRKGEVVEEIIREARRGDYDLVILGSKGASKIKKFLLGSVTNSIANRCFRALLIHR